MKHSNLLIEISFATIFLCSCSNETASFRESSPSTPAELGFESGFAEEQDYSTWMERDDGSLDPFNGKEPAEIESHGEAVGDWQALFSSSYSIVNMTLFYGDVTASDGAKTVMLFDHGISPYLEASACPSSFVDAVYSGGVWSYVFNAYTINDGTGGVKEQDYAILYTIYHAESYPYTVYLSSDYIFLMSKDSHFSKDYIATFNVKEDIHLFK
jgi:hypothetical protein